MYMCANVILMVFSAFNFGAHTAVMDDDSIWCYDKSRDYYPYYATRTPYQFVQGNLTNTRPAACTPLQMWMLSRHGARYPAEDDYPEMLKVIDVRDQIVRNHEAGAGRLCQRDLENLRRWQPNRSLSEETIGILAPQGVDDMRTLAERLQKEFPELLQTEADKVEPGDYVFRSTYLQRSRQSLEAFQFGLFGSSNVVAPIEPPEIDSLLRPHQCPTWLAELQTEYFNAEREKFTAGPEIQNLVWRISERLGFDPPLEFQTVKSMYNLCRFEESLFVNETSVWCKIFSKEHLELLEYREDLKYYYFSGPGSKVNVKLGCQSLSDMFQYFRRMKTDNATSQPKGVFYFSHSLPIQSLMAVMKFFDGSEPLSWKGYATAKDRTYRTSFFGSFSTSIIAVLNRCSGDEEKYKVALYVAEKLVTIPGCEEELCDWEDLEKTFGSVADTCNVDVCYKLERD